jgi:ketosteroid isomerase-like protein
MSGTTRKRIIGATTTPDQITDLMEQLRGGLQEFSERWLPRAGELEDFLGRWETAWNTHDLDELEALVTEDIVCEDPAMFGETVHGRSEFRAFIELCFRALPDVHVESTGALYLSHQGTGMALPWRLTATFTGELALWGKRYDAKPPTLAPTGRAVDIDGIDLYEFRDGLISRYTLIYDPVDFSQQIGLLPSLDRKVPAVVLLAQRLIASVQRRHARA